MAIGNNETRLPRRRGRFDGVELLLISIMVAIATASVTLVRSPAGFDDEQPYRERYGGRRYSANAEEWIIRDFFQDRRAGVFVDVGANHFQNNSNTYFLEQHLGWSGLAIDAQREFSAGYKAHRPRTIFISAFVSDRSGTVPLYVPKRYPALASATRESVDALDDVAEVREVPTTTLDAILEGAGIRRFDFLSMDIELAEPKALAGFDIGTYQPSLVCIEAHPPVRQALINYFAKHAYVVVGKYWLVDRWNMYFTPASQTQAVIKPVVPSALRQ
jgi:FkbM family methyltransferase